MMIRDDPSLVGLVGLVGLSPKSRSRPRNIYGPLQEQAGNKVGWGDDFIANNIFLGHDEVTPVALIKS